MKSVLVVIACMVTIICANPFRVPSKDIQIAVASQSSLPLVTKVDSCVLHVAENEFKESVFGAPLDGPVKMTGWRFSGCKSYDEDGICVVKSGELYTAEWDFIPTEHIPAVGLRIGVLTNNGTLKTVFQKDVDSSNVVAATQYTISFLGAARNETKGKTLRVQASIFRVGDDFRI